jgi:hypothetical protein
VKNVSENTQPILIFGTHILFFVMILTAVVFVDAVISVAGREERSQEENLSLE